MVFLDRGEFDEDAFNFVPTKADLPMIYVRKFQRSLSVVDRAEHWRQELIENSPFPHFRQPAMQTGNSFNECTRNVRSTEGVDNTEHHPFRQEI